VHTKAECGKKVESGQLVIQALPAASDN